MGRCTVIFLLLVNVSFAQIGADGQTYAQRQTAYFNGGAPLTFPTWQVGWMQELSQWLWNGYTGTRVDSAIDYATGTYWGVAQRFTWGAAALWLIKFSDDIGNGNLSSANTTQLKDAYVDKLITDGRYFSQGTNPNKKMWGAVGIYLYTLAYNTRPEISEYGEGSTVGEWPTFTFDGNTYTFGSGPYDANTFARDFIRHRLRSWMVGLLASVNPDGPREAFSIIYSRAYIGSLILLYEGLLVLGKDAELRTEAIMAAELYLLDHGMSFNANVLGGSIGRSNVDLLDSRFKFPVYQYFGMGDEAEDPGTRDIFLSNWKPSAVLNDIVVLTDEADTYWEITKYLIDDALHGTSSNGKWTFRTNSYTMGGAYNVDSWQVVVPGEGTNDWIRFWYDETSSAPSGETRYLGRGLRSFQNVIFAQIGVSPNYHEVLNETTWDDETTTGGFDFKQSENVMISIGTSGTAVGIEVEIENAPNSYATFKTNVTGNAVINNAYYKSSQGDSIAPGHYLGKTNPGDFDSFPFPRIYTVDNSANVILDYNVGTDVLVMSKNGATRTLDFGNWGQSGEPDPDPPNVPPIRILIMVN